MESLTQGYKYRKSQDDHDQSKLNLWIETETKTEYIKMLSVGCGTSHLLIFIPCLVWLHTEVVTLASCEGQFSVYIVLLCSTSEYLLS